ncbi:MAG: sugar phosphate isomerase/epimerase [Spirochaetales bacterium]|nr:sugar phosphate isomerase/epimerase [Spirochaetales bacterium]
MKLSASMWSLDRTVQSGGLTQETFIDWAAANNLKYVELLSYYMEKENNLDDIIKKLNHRNMFVSCYTILSDFSTSQFDALKLLEDMKTAEQLKAPFVRILGGGSQSRNDEAQKNIAAGICEAVSEAEKRGLTLILENIGPYSCHSDQMLFYMENCSHPNLRLNFDTANPLLADEDPIEALNKQMPWISYVHIKDFITDSNPLYKDHAEADPSRIQRSANGRVMTGITAGEGCIPLKDMLSLLKAEGYEGFLSIEYEGTGDSVKETEKSLSFLRSII